MKFWNVLVMREIYTEGVRRHPCGPSPTARDAERDQESRRQQCERRRLRRHDDRLIHRDEERLVAAGHVAERGTEAELGRACACRGVECERRFRRKAEDEAGLASARERFGEEL